MTADDCRPCHGTGWQGDDRCRACDDTGIPTCRQCPVCLGGGVVNPRHNRDPQDEIDCPRCDGTGLKHPPLRSTP